MRIRNIGNNIVKRSKIFRAMQKRFHPGHSNFFRTIFGDRSGSSPFGSFGQAAQQQDFDFGPKEYQVNLTFQQAARGVNKEMYVSVMDNCLRCSGTGSEPGSKPERCPSCNGKDSFFLSETLR
jgi:DnaJ-class molecular chaperone